MPWAHSVAITIDHTKVPSTQTNFPVMFAGVFPDLAGTSYGGSVTNTFGFDIIFASDSLGASPLTFERSYYVRYTGACQFFILIPSLSSTVDTTIYILYGNSSITTDQSNHTAVWDTNFNAVWHLTGTGPTNDSTSHANNLTTSLGFAFPSEFNGAAVGVAGSGGNAPASSSWNIVSDMTFSWWTKTTDNRKIWFSIQNSNPLFYADIGPTTAGGNDNVFCSYFRTNTGSVAVFNGVTTVDNGVWHHLVAVRSGATVLLYVDGLLDSTSSYGDTSAIDCSGAQASICNNGIYSPTASISEYRLSKIARSADWIKTEFNNMNSPTTFYSTTLTPASTINGYSFVPPVPSPFLGPNIRSAFNYQVVKDGFLISGSTPVPVAQILQSGTTGVAYSETISVQGGSSPYTFSVTVGALPTGTSLNSSTGVISGTPSVAGTYNFTIKVTDANGSTGTQPFEIIVSTVSGGGSFTYAG